MNRMQPTLAAVVLAVLAAAPARCRADEMGDQMRKVYEATVPSSVIVSFYIEREDRARADVRTLATVVGPANLVMFSSAAIPSAFALDQFHDFKVLVTKGMDVETYEAEYLGKDDTSQVAFVRVTDARAPDLPVLEFDEKAEVRLGDPVVSFANLGEPDAYVRVLQEGRVAARIEQPVTVWIVSGKLGALGTPALALDGRALGIVGAVQINSGTNARPRWGLVEILWPAERFIERIKNPPAGGQRVERPWLGVLTLTPLTKELAEYFKLGDRRGVIVGQTVERSPADAAGLQAEDVILSVAGKRIEGTEGQLVENFKNQLNQLKIGEEVEMEVWRGGETRTLKVALASQPPTPAEAARYKSAPFGLTVREMVLADRLARELPAAEATGVVVSFLEPAGWAADAGLRVGDVIKRVQDQDVADLAAFRKVFEAEVRKKPEEIILFVLREKSETKILRIEPRWTPAKPK